MQYKSESLKRAVRQLLATTAIVAVPMVGLPVQAQERAARTLDEIVVTARKSEESLQEVPISISAFTSQDIDDAGLRSVEDLAQLTPGFSFRSAFGRTGDRPVIRGQSNIQGEPNASFFIDGVFVSGSISGYDLDNLERVEVIRGPQSALFGRRTFSGAINYITKRPTDELSGRVTGTLGDNGLADFSGSVAGPLLGESLLFQLNSRYYERDGYYTNSVTDTKDVGGQETRSVGGTLYWLPTDNFEAMLRFNWTRNNDEHFPITLHGAEKNNCFLPTQVGFSPFPFDGVGTPVYSTRQRGYFCGTIGEPLPLAINTDGFADGGVDAGLKREAFRYSLSLDWDLGGYQLTSISAFNETSLYSGVDQDYSAIRGARGAFETVNLEKNARDYSQELRLMSPRGERLRWLGGVYYFKDESGDRFSGDLSTTLATGAAVALTQQATVDEVENQSVFAMVEYDVTEQFTLTAEARYARDKVDSFGTSNYNRFNSPAAGSDSCITTPTGATFALRCSNDRNQSETFTNFLPRFTATYLLNEDVTLYALWARGNKPGGFNNSVENARLSPTARQQLRDQGLSSFEEEEADTLELGVKTTFAEGRGLFNLSAYYIDWKNQQLTENQATAQEGGGQFVTSYTRNLGKSEVMGLEAELRYVLNDYWDVRATYALQDTEIKSFFSADQSDLIFTGYPASPAPGIVPCVGACQEAYIAAGDVSGNRLPRVPLHSATVSATFRMGMAMLPTAPEFFFRGDYSIEGSRYSQVHNLAETGSSNLWNFRAGLDADNWTLTVFVNNAFNDRTPVDILRFVDASQPGLSPAAPPLGGSPFSGYNPFFIRDFGITLPNLRQVGATLVYRF